MTIETLLDNVLQIEIAVYLAAPTLAIAVLSVTDLPPGQRIALFAGFVVLWSATFPGIVGRTLSKPVVDFWYYSLSILGVMLFFLSNTVQRERIELADDFR